MKQYTLYFKEAIPVEVTMDRYNKETRTWSEVKTISMMSIVHLSSLAAAKKLIKKHIDKYEGSCITKTWANGDWENLGEINLEGSNKTFVANTRQTKANY